MKNVNSKKTVFRCDICCEDIPRVDKHKHIRLHFATNRRPRKCKLCGKSFATPARLENHVRSHTKEMLYSCDTCGKEFNQKSNWKTHQKVHQVPAGMIQCAKCYIKLKKSIGLERHAIFCGKESDYYTVEEVENPKKNPNARKKTDTIYRCNQCPDDAPKRRKEYMEDHVIRAHLKVKLHCCYFCDIKFIHRTELQIHLRSHTGEKPFTCKTCGKGFSQSTHYNMHQVSHSEERTFKVE
ncbi:hypothetical protein Fcan01_27896 [Folsomia candida]|uniref:C2H2-type domain-containing protein n=1 Tax=Folsomia candida TaxID=158441 RepID=A0A226CVA6_FOLCA|nr:hypothetical protein Fcan01_27896 [Folsomia candida]